MIEGNPVGIEVKKVISLGIVLREEYYVALSVVPKIFERSTVTVKAVKITVLAAVKTTNKAVAQVQKPYQFVVEELPIRDHFSQSTYTGKLSTL